MDLGLGWNQNYTFNVTHQEVVFHGNRKARRMAWLF